jgi:hypothetical protein
MAKVTKITDENNPGLGFFKVEGVDGYFPEEVANRVAAQMDAKVVADAAVLPVVEPPPPLAGGNVACPSCGHTFQVKEFAELLNVKPEPVEPAFRPSPTQPDPPPPPEPPTP